MAAKAAGSCSNPVHDPFVSVDFSRLVTCLVVKFVGTYFDVVL